MDQLCQGHRQALGRLFEPLAVVLCRGPYLLCVTDKPGWAELDLPGVTQAVGARAGAQL